MLLEQQCKEEDVEIQCNSLQDGRESKIQIYVLHPKSAMSTKRQSYFVFLSKSVGHSMGYPYVSLIPWYVPCRPKYYELGLMVHLVLVLIGTPSICMTPS